MLINSLKKFIENNPSEYPWDYRICNRNPNFKGPVQEQDISRKSRVLIEFVKAKKLRVFCTRTR